MPSRAELSTVVELVRTHRAALVNVGHGRDPRSVASAGAFIEEWSAVGGDIGAIVSWPATAASWLRPACRLAAGAPDAWVIASGVDEWAGLGGRLAASGSWQARRTVGFAALGDPRLPSVVGVAATEGLHGAFGDGTAWTFRDGLLLPCSEINPTGRE